MDLQVFINRFQEIFSEAPRLYSSARDNENCPFCDELAYSKNCYRCFVGAWAEDSYYNNFIVKVRDCIDCTKIVDCELCYECVDCDNCYNSNFLLNCKNTRDSEYCYELRGSNHCFLSSTKRNQSFLFKNQKYSEKEYYELVAKYKAERSREDLIKEFMQLVDDSIHVNVNNIKTENSFGNDLTNCNNVYRGFDLVNAEDFIYALEGGYGKDCCDTFLTTGQLNYECVWVTKESYNCNYCLDLTTCVNCELCMACYNSSDLFACAYVNRKKFHILNEPYSEADYHKEVASIKRQLLEAGMLNLDMFTKLFV